MIEYRILPSESKAQSRRINVSITSSFTSEYIGTPMYFGRLENGREIVLKFTKMSGGAEREFNGLTLANSHGISSPKAIALIQRDEEPKTGFIMERIEGQPLDKIGTSSHEFKLGQEVKKLHEIKMPGYGPITNGVGQFENAEQYIKYWLDRTVPHIGEQSQAVQLMTELFTQGREHILSQEPRLLHRDLKDQNVLIKADGNVSIIDFEWAQGGNPLDDLAVYLYHSIRTNKAQNKIQSFLRGYFDGKELTDLEKYDLLFHLVLAASRTVSFCARMNPSRLDEAKQDMDKVVLYAKGILKNTPGYN